MRPEQHPDARVARLAAAQHGVVAHAQLLGCGLSPDAIAHRVRGLRLHRLHRGVYAVGHAAPTELGPIVAGLLAVGEGAHVSHRACAAIHGFGDPVPGAIDITVARRGPHSRPGLRVHRVRRLHPRDVGRRLGLPVIAPARTLLDLAGEMGADDLEAAYERARVLRLVRPADVRAALDRAPGLRGAGLLRALVEDRPGLTRSAAERRLLDLVRRGGLPDPVTNVRVAGHEVDLLWRSARLVVEVDGYAWHRGRRAFEQDRRRDADLQASGFRVLRVTWRRIEQQPEAVLVTLTRALER